MAENDRVVRRILCYGDSNTWGYTPGSGMRYDEKTRWTRICQDLLGGEYEIIENGINGRTTVFDPPWANNRNGLEGLGYALLSQMPIDLAIIMLGTNDLAMSSMTRAVQGIEKLLRQVIHANEIYDCAPNSIFRDKVRVLLVAPIPFDSIVDTFADKSVYGKYHESLQFAEKYCELAEKYNTFFLDAGLYASASTIDGVHFTAKAHMDLANAMAQKIKDIFCG